MTTTVNTIAPTASTREVVGKKLVELGKRHPNLVVLGGDLNKSTYANMFGKEFPDRFFDFGPAEQNIVNVAAGMASSGKVAVVSTFSVFGTGRPYDQLRVGVAQPNLNVKLFLTHSGIITGEDGVSAHSIEDVAIISALPTFKVIVPADGPEAEQVAAAAVETPGPFFVRLSRSATPVIHKPDFRFRLGVAEEMREGRDVAIIACGIMVDAALKAAAKLAEGGVECRVLNMATIKPLDEQAVLKAAQETGAIVTAEEHLLEGGLGSMVSSLLARKRPTPVETVALSGYAESGAPALLLEKYHLTPADIASAVQRAVSRKKG
jgi:transketolase